MKHVIHRKSATIALLSLTILTACSSDSDSEPVDFSGNYSLSATALTEFDTNGGTCGDGSGNMTIADGMLTGSVLSTNGNLFDVTGTVTESGDITGGFGQSGQLVVNFSGALNATGGTGTWEDLLECSGTWDAVKE